MRRALIGYTGFVGSNLDVQTAFTDRYNSKNFRAMRGERYDEVVCAGIQAVKWWANQNPEQDWAGIQPLLDVLSTSRIGRFILISTVDVYLDPVAVDESTPIVIAELHSYGLHRWRVEEWVRSRHDNHMIARLPGLYGRGLKKNLIYDLLAGKPVDGFDARSTFQFYDLNRLSGDLERASGAELQTVNLAVPPVTVADVAERVTGEAFRNQTERPPVRYDMRTMHAAAWGVTGGYLEPVASSLNSIESFARRWREEALQ